MPETTEQATRPAASLPLSQSGETVTVACKLPSGVVLRTFTMEEVYEPVLGGGTRKTTRAVRDPTEVTLNGYGFNILEASKGVLPGHAIIGGYGLTPGVPKDLWDKWYEDNKASALVQNNIVFAHKTSGGAGDMAREHAGQLSGLEPLDPDNPGSKSADLRRVRRGTRENSDADNL